MAKQAPAPPYAPGFGRRPPVVAGRDALLDDTAPGGAGVEKVAKALGKEPRQLAVARDRLVHRHGLLEVPERAKVRFVDGEMATWVGRRPGGTSTTAIVHKGPALSESQGRGRPSTSPSRDASGRRRPSANRPKDLGR